MKKLVILLIALSFFPAVAQEEGNDSELNELVTYVFPLHGQDFRVMFSLLDEQEVESGSTKDDPFGGGSAKRRTTPKKMFSRYGVSFPAGSSIEYDPFLVSIVMTNTMENQKRLHKILNTRSVSPTQVAMHFQVFSLQEDKVQEIEKKQEKPLVAEDVVKLWKRDLATLKMSQSLITLHGVNAIMEAGWMMDGSEQGILLNVTPTVSSDNHCGFK